MSEERLILVDERNRKIGSAGKTMVHQTGSLHRAFSIFIVDRHCRLLLQRRSRAKYHSGGLLANSCCGHPRPGENTRIAAARRLTEELGMAAPLTFGFHSRYKAALDRGMHENEFVYVFFGPLTMRPNPNPDEVSQIEFEDASAIARRIKQRPDAFTCWLRHYFENHRDEIERCLQPAALKACDFNPPRSASAL